MNENIIPIRKSEKFHLCKGEITAAGILIEKERVGIAFMNPGSNICPLHLSMFPKAKYFLARELNEPSKYVALCLEEYELASESKKQWHKVGVGELVGGYIRIRFHLLSEDIFLCLSPSEKKEISDAA